MTKDFLISFENEKESIKAEEVLLNIKINDKEELFSKLDNRGKDLFVTLTYENEIHKSCFVKFKEKKINIVNETVFVAIKNGMHHEKGLAFFINKVSKFAPDNNSHVKNIQSTILSFFGINN